MGLDTNKCGQAKFICLIALQANIYEGFRAAEYSR